MCNIHFYEACHTVGVYFHHLYDFLDANKMISFTAKEKIDAIEVAKDAQAKKLTQYKDRMTEMAYEFALTEIAAGKIDLVVNAAKIELLKSVIKDIDLKKVKELL